MTSPIYSGLVRVYCISLAVHLQQCTYLRTLQHRIVKMINTGSERIPNPKQSWSEILVQYLPGGTKDNYKAPQSG
jgi:hypothetical protein